MGEPEQSPIRGGSVIARRAVFTDRELDVMGVLWDSGSGTVAEVKDGIEDELAYTTVLTILRTLEDKGYVGHREEGRAHRYLPLVSREEAQASHLERLLLKLFHNSPGLLLDRLITHPGIPAKRRTDLKKALRTESK
jgi:predicted transcriptional regulator